MFAGIVSYNKQTACFVLKKIKKREQFALSSNQVFGIPKKQITTKSPRINADILIVFVFLITKSPNFG